MTPKNEQTPKFSVLIHADQDLLSQVHAYNATEALFESTDYLPPSRVMVLPNGVECHFSEGHRGPQPLRNQKAMRVIEYLAPGRGRELHGPVLVVGLTAREVMHVLRAAAEVTL